MERLRIYTQIPDGFLQLTSPRDVCRLFPSSTLFDLPGAMGKGAIFLGALIHGNETTSFYVIQEFLRTWRPMQGPRVMIFWGNIQAASHGLRQMPSGVDFNRIWDGPRVPEFAWANELLERIQTVSPYVGLDIHNTSGSNPLFSCLSEINPKLLCLAQAFAPKIFYSGKIKNVLSYQVNKICPALTLECAQSGDEVGKQRALALVHRLYHEGPQFFSSNVLVSESIPFEIYECIGQLKLGAKWRPIFSGPTLDESSVILNHELESYNFQSLPAGNWIARGGGPGAIEVVANEGKPMTEQFIEYQNGYWRLKQNIIPAMMSNHLAIIESDCWGHLLKRLPLAEIERDLL